jgi:hypothetical protein
MPLKFFYGRFRAMVPVRFLTFTADTNKENNFSPRELPRVPKLVFYM